MTEIKIISHSNVFYWWPAWVVGFAVALISFVQGREIAIEPGIVERVHPSNNPGIFLYRCRRDARRFHDY